MPKRNLGALEVSAQGLGCMGMSHAYGVRDDDESVATIDRALDAGVTLLDTANVYGDGQNERLVGSAIADRRDEVVLATKFGIVNTGGEQRVRGDPEYVRQCCEDSLRRLGVEHIDLYYQHRVAPDVPVEETFGALSDLVAEGKIRHVGMSEAGADTIRRAHAVHAVTALQSEWSLWTRDIEAEIVPTCRELGIGIVPFSPLGRGLLTGAVTSIDDLSENDARRGFPRFSGSNLDRNLGIVAALRDLAAARGLTAGQLALAWVQHQGADVVPIPGTKRRTYLDENIGAATVELTAEDLSSIEDATPVDAVSGERYPEHYARTVQR